MGIRNSYRKDRADLRDERHTLAPDKPVSAKTKTRKNYWGLMYLPVVTETLKEFYLKRNPNWVNEWKLLGWYNTEKQALQAYKDSIKNSWLKSSKYKIVRRNER